MLNWLSNTVGGWLGNVAQGVKDLIYSVVSSVIGWASSMFDWVTDWVNRVIGWANSAIGAIWHGITDVYGWASGAINQLAQWTYNALNAAIGDITRWVSGWLNDVIRWASAAFSDLWRWANWLPGWVVDNVWRPLADAIGGALRWVSDTVVPWVRQGLDDITGWATQAFNHVWDVLSAVYNFVMRWGGTIVGFFVRAADWVAVMVAWPFTAITELIGGLWRRSPSSFVDTAQQAFQQEGGGIEDMLTRWLGGTFVATVVATTVMLLLFGDTKRGRR